MEARRRSSSINLCAVDVAAPTRRASERAAQKRHRKEEFCQWSKPDHVGRHINTGRFCQSSNGGVGVQGYGCLEYRLQAGFFLKRFD